MTRLEALLFPSWTRLAWSNLAFQFIEKVGLVTGPKLTAVVCYVQADPTAWLLAAGVLPLLLLAVAVGLLAGRMLRRQSVAMAACFAAAGLRSQRSRAVRRWSNSRRIPRSLDRCAASLRRRCGAPLRRGAFDRGSFSPRTAPRIARGDRPAISHSL